MSDISKRLEKAEKYLQKGRQEDALKEYLEALREDPSNDTVRQTAADLSIALGAHSRAVELLHYLFERQAEIGDVSKAVANYKKMARLATPKIDHTFRYAQLVEKSSRREAVDAYEKVVRGFTSAGRKAEALAALRRIVALDPTLANFKREAELAAELGDGKTAAAGFLKVGDLQKQAGANPIAWYERAHQFDPQSADAALQYGKCLLAAGRAAEAIGALRPFATQASARIPDREAYGKALLAAGKLTEAEPFIWALYEADPKQDDEVASLIGALLDADHHAHAVELAHKLEVVQGKLGNQREFVAGMKEISDHRHPSIDFLEYMVEVFNSANREHDYCDTLLKLFELYYASGNFMKAAECLDRSAEVDPYEPGHERRLDMLRGKVDSIQFNAIANRFNVVLKQDEKDDDNATEEEVVDEGESTILEDLILQAEIFIQYSMRSKAVERLERINKLFPHEEDKNDKLRALFNGAGFFPQYTPVSAPPPTHVAQPPAPVAPAPVAPPRPAAPPPPAAPAAVPIAQQNESAVDNFARVTEMTRNIYRQGSVKGVLFTAVNEIGRHWNSSRCVSALITPGKPPSAALEYCGPGVPAADVISLVKLVQACLNLAVISGTVKSINVPGDPGFDDAREVVKSLKIESLLAVPLMDGDEHAGILILEQTGKPRNWRPTDEVVLKTIAEQMVLAVNNARLRSLVKTLAVTEEKSGLLKRSSYLDVLLSETKRAMEQDTLLSVMLMHFGKTGAMIREYGEAAVDGLMQQVGQVIISHIRQTDVAVRYDVTTIALVLADTTEKNGFFVVNKMRKVLSAVHLPGKTLPVSLTVGIAEAVVQSKFDPVDIVTEVINRAEAALEAAKAEGVNSAKSLGAPALEGVAASAG
jgi:diguanylate cyclase (GGDEF)-like protein